ncbi:ROK family protein [Dactylosporangium sp. NPDC051541]|uniref:ROK family protein n=1 Tax=Dactylosporangium sp. NPDC051541 TaxID=3363977 RepID=UPI0037A75FCB
MSAARLYGGVEAGGTKVVCGIGDGSASLRHRITIPTTTPSETLDGVVHYFTAQRAAGHDITALGVASFGPLDLAPGSASFGHITTTSKPGWKDTDLVGTLTQGLGVPVALDTDVNGAAVGEHRWGAGRGHDDLVYITVGTGIGGGAVVGGRPLHGLLHPEMGHLHVRRHPGDPLAGVCPYHGDCLEGLASGPAIEERADRPATTLSAAQHREVVEFEAFYLAQLVASVVYLLMPRRIILGGGVLKLPGLLDAVRAATVGRLAGALALHEVSAGIDDFLVSPDLGDDSGVIGAVALACTMPRTAADRRPHDGPPRRVR